MLVMVVLAQEDRARIGDHLHLCLGNAASVTRNPGVLAYAGFVVAHHPRDAPGRGEVVPEDSHRLSLQKVMSGPFFTTAGPVAARPRGSLEQGSGVTGRVTPVT